MPAAPARRDPEVVNQAVGVNQPARTYQRAPRLTDQDTFTPRRDPTPGLAATLIGTAATAASGWTAAMPWIPAIDFLHHVWQLAPASTRG
jgi:hypothetical protein